MITIDDFAKVEMRVGEVTEARDVDGSLKLIRLTVNFGDEVRTIFTGVRQWYKPKYFLNKRFVFVTNLESKMMPSFAPDGATKGKGEESQGMIMAADGIDGKPIFLVPASKKVEVGACLR
ncbi:MAG: Methionine-tRNA ligase [Candidatus Woesebacteria bacterium GW2011_GWA1_43_12]|uniref:Methionine-tRNA ligase n=1 Tax=Candidatus Woesebacteria bacterium GW2011_GWA1_43_12 TaxID=1618557 RepID=A0A0G1F460_9BACT|nr:MAG: Methionine-tRNA ligase [Candidatus Woesebacteria bacterium GW2011_GWA1_43_12]